MTDVDVLQSFRLDSRTILVTGASGHLGWPIARGLAALGAKPVLAGRRSERLQALQEDVERSGGRCSTIAFDVGDVEACRRAMAGLAQREGRLDGVVNAAYGGASASLESTTDADFVAAFEQNLAGPFALIQAALPLLRASAPMIRGGASIVNVASMYARVSPDPSIYGDSGKNNPPHYGATKAGLLQLTRYLAVHLGADGIRVNSVSPGPFPPASIASTSPGFHASLCAKTPLGRIGMASELVGPVVFLLSEAASFVTGADLAVDGGWTAW